MNYFSLAAEVAGGLGKRTVMTRNHPPVVTRLHYQFDGWLGDDLIESFPCYIITQRLARVIQEAGFTGYELGPVETTRSEEFEELHPDRALPQFVWLKVTGKAGL